jgi:hypothetical protein
MAYNKYRVIEDISDMQIGTLSLKFFLFKITQKDWFLY